MGIGIYQVVTSGQKLKPNTSWTFFVYPPPPPQPSVKTLNNLVSARAWINKVTFPALVKWRLKTKIQLLQEKKSVSFLHGSLSCAAGTQWYQQSLQTLPSVNSFVGFCFCFVLFLACYNRSFVQFLQKHWQNKFQLQIHRYTLQSVKLYITKKYR